MNETPDPRNTFVRRTILLAGAAVALGVLLATGAATPRTAFGASYVVDTTSDSDLTACTAAAGDCSLRGAINNANGGGGPDTITFDTGVFLTTSPASIILGSALPDITTDVTIDGTNTGVILDGGGLHTCLTISGGNNTVIGIREWRNCSTGISIAGSNNNIGGLNQPETGTSCANAIDDDLDGYVNDGCPQAGANAEVGADCANATDDDPIDLDGAVNDGCPARGQGMVLSSHSGEAIQITGSNNNVIGNYIGTNTDGAAADANAAGIVIMSGAGGNLIGGDQPGERNIISGNTSYGVLITGSGTDGNTVSGNYIGTNAAGTAAVANGTGVLIQLDADNNTVGGSTAGHRNVISGNTNAGVGITGIGTSGNTVQGNYIGTNAAGTAALGNGLDGIRIDIAGSNTIGGTTAGAGNIISGNAGDGVSIHNGSSSNVVQGNYIGTNSAGTAAIANGSNGVSISLGATANTVGGSTAGHRNVISGNTNAGVQIAGTGTSGNSLKGNYIGTNAAGTAAIANVGFGVRIFSDASANTVGGSSAGDGNIISGNAGPGVVIAASSSNVVQGNYIGTNAAGTAQPNVIGVQLGGGATNNTVGGSTPGQRNVISGNSGAGVQITGIGTTGNSVQGNYIGTNAAGSAAVGNTGDGVRIDAGASANSIGGTAAAERNLISGNTVNGVRIAGSGTNGNTVSGNYIGTNPAGVSPIANATGIRVEAGNNTIGGGAGTTPGGNCTGACNLISGNSSVGVLADATGITLKGNYIGTDVTGSLDLGNGNAGVRISNTFTAGTVGGSAAGEGNVISGNNAGGLDIQGSDNATVYGNYIGTNANGANIGNTSFGVQLDSFSNSNVIGGTSVGQGNVIAFNTLDGVEVFDSTATMNSVRGNSIYANGDLGIDLNPTGVTANDAGDGDTGPNDLQNFPVITSVVVGSTTISGTLDTSSPDTALVDVYASDVADGSGNGEGHAFLGTAIPDTLGAWSLTISGVPPYASITATATKGGSTSEFSAVYTISSSPEPGLPSTAIAYKGQASPIGSTYNFFGPGQVPNTTGEVVFWSSLLSGTQGVFRWLSGTTTKYVATGDAAPGGGTFTDLTDAPVVNEAGDLAFWAATSAPTEGIYHRTAGGVITKLVGVGDAAPGGSTFSSFDPPSGKGIAVINNLGDVSFWASLASGGQGVYMRQADVDGTLLKVAATGDATPAGGTFSTFLSGAGYATIPIVTENQEVAFRGFTAGGPAQGLFLYSQGSGLTKIASSGDTAPTGGSYSSFGRAPSANDSGQVAFWASLSGSARPSCPSAAAPCGVFIWEDGASTKAFASGDAASPQTGGLISDLGTGAFMNDTGQISTWAGISGGLASQAIVRYTAGYIQNVAAIGNASAIGGTFSDFIDPSGFPTNPLPNNQGRVVYWGDVSGGSGPEGVFITDAPTAPSIVAGPVAGAPAPGTNGGTFGNNFDLDINSTGTAVFANTVEGGSASSGIFLFFAGQPVGDVALQGQDAPGGGKFSNFYFPVNNDGGQIAAKATTSGGPAEGLYLFFAGSSARMAAAGETAPGGGGTYLFFAGSPSINNAGQVASVSSLSGGASGLYLFFAGSPLPGVPCQNVGGFEQCQLASASGAAPGGGTYLFFAGSPAINNSGTVAQRATLSTGEGLYLFFAGSSPAGATCQLVSGIQQCKLAATDDLAPGGGTFSAFGSPVVNADGVTAAPATVSGGTDGLFLFFAGSPTTRLASVGDPALGSSFTGFTNATINDHGMVVAQATLANGLEGLFLFFAGNPLVKVALEDDPAATGTGTYGGSSPVFPYMAMNNGAQIVFVANITGGSTTQGVFLASMDFDGDGVLDFLDNCPTLANTDQNNTDKALAAAGLNVVADELGNACDDDDDGDGVLDGAEAGIICRIRPDCNFNSLVDGVEAPCGSDPSASGSRPERIDGIFAGVDDDGDAQVDEALPPGAEAYDCDGDGYTGAAENGTALCGNGKNDDDKTYPVYPGPLVADDAVIDDGCGANPVAGLFSEAQFNIGGNDQDPCGLASWPSDFVSGGVPVSTNKINILDLTTFIAPPESRRLDTAAGHPAFDKRWDLSPGRGVFNNMINVTDLTSLIAGPSGFPPMLEGAKAFNGPSCPWAP